jgi:hypothetical protein
MRQRLEEPAGETSGRPQSGLPPLTPSVIAPPASLLVDEPPLQEHRRTWDRGYLGNAGYDHVPRGGTACRISLEPRLPMNVFAAFSGLPLWFIASLLLCVIPAVAALAAFLIRRGVGFERLVLSNEIAGFQYSTLGVMYAVLLALAVVAVWADFREARRLVDREVAAWAILYRLNDALPGPGQDSLRSALLGYGHAVLEDEWPAMARLAGSDAATTAMRRLRHAVVSVEVTDQRGAAVYSEMLDRLADLTEARRGRLDMIPGSLPPLIDTVLVAGALLTITFTLFFAGRDFYIQAMMTSMLCFMIMLVLFAAIELNYPFAGGVHLASDPFVQMLQDAEEPK